MPCDAISVSKAAITEERLLALLSPEVIQKVLLTYLQQQYPAYAPFQVDIAPQSKRITCTVGDCQVTIRNGRVTVESTSSASFAETLASQLAQLLAQLADRLFEEQVQQILAPYITSTAVATVDNNGVKQRAVVLTLKR